MKTQDKTTQKTWNKINLPLDGRVVEIMLFDGTKDRAQIIDLADNGIIFLSESTPHPSYQGANLDYCIEEVKKWRDVQ